MQLYFSPMSCSLASRIAFYEAGAEPEFIEVDRVTKQIAGGGNYREIYPLGLVPALRLETGEILTENAAVLQQIATRYPQAELAPADPLGRARLQQWLGFIGAELHKGLFIPLLDKKSPEGTRAHVLEKSRARLDYLNLHLQGREFLLDKFSVADAYLVTVLNWTVATEFDLTPWPALLAYHRQMRARPSVSRAVEEEYSLYKAELARRAAA